MLAITCGKHIAKLPGVREEPEECPAEMEVQKFHRLSKKNFFKTKNVQFDYETKRVNSFVRQLGLAPVP